MRISRKAGFIISIFFAGLFAVVNWLYWPMVLRAGVLNPEADSVFVPMMSGLVVSPLLAVLLSAWTIPALSKASASVDLFARGSGWRAIAGNFLYGGAALVFLLVALSVVIPGGEIVGAVWWVWLLPFAAWNLVLRAALAERTTQN